MSKKDKLLKTALKNVKENQKIVFLTDVYQSIGISASTFYRNFPVNSDEYNQIVDALEANKTLMKRDIRDRLANCKSPVGLLALYRLLGNQEERDALNSYREEKVSKQEDTIELEIQ